MEKLKEIPFKSAAVTIALITAAVLAPLLAVPLLILSVAPQVIMLKSGEYQKTAALWGIAALFIYFFFGAGYLLTYLLVFGVFAVAAAKYILPAKDGPYVKVIRFALCWLILFSVWQIAAYFLFKFNAAEVITGTMENVMAAGIGRYYKLGMQPRQVEALDSALMNMTGYFKTGFFGWLTVSALTGSYFLYYALTKNTGIKKLPGIVYFKAWDNLIWCLMAAALLYMLGLNLGGSYNIFIVTGLNGLIVLLFGYCISGLGVFSMLFSKAGMNSFMKILFLAAMFLFFKGIYFFTAAGILDTWFNFRGSD